MLSSIIKHKKNGKANRIVGAANACGCFGSVFIIAILAAILFPVFAQARQKARETSSMSNMKQLGLATLQYAQDHGEKLPRMDSQENFKAALSKYILQENYDVFLDPQTKTPYILNKKLSGKSLDTINDPAHTELMRSPGDYNGFVLVGYVDGHVRAVPMEELQ